MGASYYTAIQRRAANQVWNAAGEYGFEPMFLARHTDGTPDFYMNCMVGFVRKYYGEELVQKLFAGWAGDAREAMLDDLAWLYLEHAAYLLECGERPFLAELRRAHASEFFGQEYKLSRQEWMAKNQLVYAMQNARWSSVIEKRLPVLTPYEKGLFKALSPDKPPGPEQLLQKLLEIFLQFCLFDGKIRKKTELRFHFTGAFAALLLKTMPARLIKTDRVTVERSENAGSPQDGALMQDKRRARISLSQNWEKDRAYIERCFGRSLYSPKQLLQTERELCTGVHFGCHLWFTDGETPPDKPLSKEARQLADEAQLQAERNRAWFLKNLELYGSVEKRLTEQIKNCLLVHQSENAAPSRSGRLDASFVWRASLLADDRVFHRMEEENRPFFTVDLLLDASASRLRCQEVLAAQGVILAKSLAACRIPVRVSSFCSLRGCTVLRILKKFEEKRTQPIFRYFASGWNRDGLVLRAAGDLIRTFPGPAKRHLIILLTDASPNDSRRIPPSKEYPLGHDYEGAAGVMDAAAQVRALKASGIRTSAVFMGMDSSVAAAKTIYGKSMVRIRGVDQLALAGGRLIQDEIRALDG